MDLITLDKVIKCGGNGHNAAEMNMNELLADGQNAESSNNKNNAAHNQKAPMASSPEAEVKDDGEAPSHSSSASSTSTQWPSAPASPTNPSREDDTQQLQGILDRALDDPFSTHPDVAAELKNNTRKHCQLAAAKIHEADVLLVITGAGFSADSGLATYLDVADVDAYRNRGWRYRDLCTPPTFADFNGLKIHERGGEIYGEAGSVANEEGEERGGIAAAKRDAIENNNANDVDFDGISRPHLIRRRRQDYHNFGFNDVDSDGDFTPALPDEDDINHPQYFYGFWGQCVNDYRGVKPHDGYDILARWGRDKNNDENASSVAEEIRKITSMLEHRGDDIDSDSSDGSGHFHFKEDDEEEPYYVSPTKRAGAFFVFTSNVDAHSFDVFESHEIRECHGNVELWQCHNFACGTNDTALHGGSLDGSDAGGGDNVDEEQDQAQKWQRRLWRLPMEYKFMVNRKSMSAPYSKTPLKSQPSENIAAAAETAEESLGSPPASKRRKSSMQDDYIESTASSVSDQGNKHGIEAVSDSADNNDARDTATALGGMMEAALRNHLEKKSEESKSCNDASTKTKDSNGISHSQHAHIGDVHGNPRLFPLRHMHSPTTEPIDNEGESAQNYYLPISPNQNWPTCPRCGEAARPAVLMFGDLDWVFNLKQEQRWQRWCHSLLKLCKQRARGNNGFAGFGSDSSSTVSGANMSENGWEDVTTEPSTEQKTDGVDEGPASAPSPVQSEQSNTANSASPPQHPNQPHPPLKVAILEIGCGYNVPTCRVIAERLVGELSMRGGDATLIRINPSHPEPDDHSVEDFTISIMEKGLAALKLIDEHYHELAKEE